MASLLFFTFFFFNDTPPTEIYTLSLHDALPIRTGGSRFQTSDLYNPEINVRYGSWYLRHLLDKYREERTALAAYNAGQQNVDEWRREGRGIAFSETRHYVKRVERLKTLYRRGYAGELGTTSS